VIDGYPGVLWEDFRERLDAALSMRSACAHTGPMSPRPFKPAADHRRMLAPFLGGDDPIFGFRFPGQLADFFEPAAVLQRFSPTQSAGMNILYGCGAALAGWQGPLVYVDVPKNEIQFRQRAGSVTCLGAEQPLDAQSRLQAQLLCGLGGGQPPQAGAA
jgi:hypothetical protein